VNNFGEGIRDREQPFCVKFLVVNSEEQGIHRKGADFPGLQEAVAQIDGLLDLSGPHQFSQPIQVPGRLAGIEFPVVLRINELVEPVGEKLADASRPKHGQRDRDGNEQETATGSAGPHQEQSYAASQGSAVEVRGLVFAGDRRIASAQPPGHPGGKQQWSEKQRVHAATCLVSDSAKQSRLRAA
jgi:hypothetical protein